MIGLSPIPGAATPSASLKIVRPAPPGRRPNLGAAAAVAGLALLVVVGASVAGPWVLEERQWESPLARVERPEPLEPLPLPPPFRSATPRPGSGEPLDLSWLPIVGIVLLAGVVVAALIWLWQRYRQADTGEQVAPLGDGIAVEGHVEPKIPVLQQGVRVARHFLDQVGDPTDAIVAAWLALEEAAAASGVYREPAATPTEFTVDVLERTKASPAATAELLHLYHRARFASAGAEPGDVEAAARCLAVLANDWESLSPAAAQPRGEVPGD